jgi:hypothetical protein
LEDTFAVSVLNSCWDSMMAIESSLAFDVTNVDLSKSTSAAEVIQ